VRRRQGFEDTFEDAFAVLPQHDDEKTVEDTDEKPENGSNVSLDHVMNKSNGREDIHEKPEKRDKVDDINSRAAAAAAPGSHTSLDCPLLKQRLSLGMLIFHY
jgi:hypothetical protein